MFKHSLFSTFDLYGGKSGIDCMASVLPEVV